MTKLISNVGAKKANPKPIQKGMRGLLFRDWASFAPATRTTAVPKVKEVRIMEILYPSPAPKTSPRSGLGRTGLFERLPLKVNRLGFSIDPDLSLPASKVRRLLEVRRDDNLPLWIDISEFPRDTILKLHPSHPF